MLKIINDVKFKNLDSTVEGNEVAIQLDIEPLNDIDVITKVHAQVGNKIKEKYRFEIDIQVEMLNFLEGTHFTTNKEVLDYALQETNNELIECIKMAEYLFCQKTFAN